MLQLTEFGRWLPRQRRRNSLNRHRNDGLELVYISLGNLRWAVEGRAEAVPPRSLFFTMPWQEHGGTEEVEPGAALAWIVLPLVGGPRDWRFHPDLGLRLDAAAQASLRRAFATTRHCHPIRGLAGPLLERCVDLLIAGSSDSHLLPSLLRGLVAEAAATVAASGSVSGADSRTPGLVAVQRWIAAVRREPQRGGTLPQWAAACGLGRTRFTALVRHETGDSPVVFRNRMRVERACALLRQGRRSITAIALDCGFGTSQYFARVFRQLRGKEPSAWRAQQRGR